MYKDSGRVIQEKANVLWNVANTISGLYKPHEYGLVILPMAAVKRFHDCLIETHDAVLQRVEEVKTLAVKDAFLREASGYPFFNTSKFTFETLVADPKNIGANFRDFLNGFSDNVKDVLEQMASNPKVCRYLDIPLQHISDKVLDMMHRHVDGAWTRALVRKLRERVPGVVLRTTMIVGHPGETETEFDELLDFVREARFERLGAFTYSEEEGTYGAENFEDSLPQEEKDVRLNALMSLQSSISLSFNQSRVGSVERVIADEYSDGILVCRSQYESPDVDGEILVGKRPGIKVGDFINVRITAADEYDLTAEII